MMDLKSLDMKFQRRPPDDLPPPKVVVAAIDEKGVERYGLWPWSRAVIGQFITKATEGGAKVVGFDAVFSDEDKNSSYASIKRFVDGMKGVTATSEAPELQKIVAAVLDAEVEHTRAVQALQELEHKLKKQRGDKVLTKALSEARAAEEKCRGKLTEAHETLTVWQKSAERFMAQVRQETAGASPDDVLANAIAKSPQTVLGYFNFYNTQEIVGVSKDEIASDFARVERSAIEHVYESVTREAGGQEIEILQPVASAPVDGLQIRPVVALQAPLMKFAEKATGFGFFNVTPDPDGPMRRVRLLNRFGNKLYPALSLLLAARALDGDIRPLNGTIKPGRTLDGINLAPGVEAPTDLHGRLLVNYYTDPQTYFPTYSVADFIDGTVPPEAYKGKVVLFGMTAQGLFDLRPTPFSATTPGVYIHASAVQNMLDNRFLERYYGLALVEMAGYLALGLLMGLVIPRLSVFSGILATIGFALGLYFFDVHVVFARGVWMLNVLPTLQAAVTFMGISAYGYLTEGREKRQIRQAFQYYLTASVVDEMLKDTTKLRLGGERRVCTVLFSDVRGFTTISEKLSPEELVSLLNSYLTPMTNLVFKYDGTLDKYMGDAIMAIFGAPIGYENHPSRACFVALEMLEELKNLQAGWRAQNLPEIDIGIGLNTGPMSVGNMGSTVRFDYTVMGDNVNLGSRLEGINKQYGTNIIISEFTYAAARQDVHAREMDSVRVKGKKEPVKIYELLGRGAPDPAAQALITTFESGIASYKAQAWD
ncbi:MAG TPA: adenylate/guanylate cyclase domain-containing protein, partial [Myxococcota bacterium]|nr:adenylate/guanylate cyclase domain-containing protein [Myxococcota bacterium]